MAKKYDWEISHAQKYKMDAICKVLPFLKQERDDIKYKKPASDFISLHYQADKDPDVSTDIHQYFYDLYRLLYKSEVSVLKQLAKSYATATTTVSLVAYYRDTKSLYKGDRHFIDLMTLVINYSNTRFTKLKSSQSSGYQQLKPFTHYSDCFSFLDDAVRIYEIITDSPLLPLKESVALETKDLCLDCNEHKAEFYSEDVFHYSSDKPTLCHSCYISSLDRTISRPVTTVSKSVTPQPKEESSMLDKFKGLLGEFGKNTSSRFKLSFQGIAYKTDAGDYVAFSNDEVTNVMDMVLPSSGDMIFNMPATIDQLAKGDIIISNKRVLFIRSISKKGITAIDPNTNDEVRHIPQKNLFGMQFYTKVISMMNFAQQPQAGAQPFNPMMLMMMSDKDSSLNDILPLMMMSGQLGGAPGQQNNQMQQMLPLLMLSDKSGGGSDNKMLEMMMLSQFFSGAQANPFAQMFGQPTDPTQSE